jgi:O-antigen/teichoic acid export membrane protein
VSAAETPPIDPPGDILDSSEAGAIVVRGGVVRVAGFGLGIVCSLGGVVLVTRHLGTDDFGRFQTVLNLLLVVQAVTDVGMATLGMREFAQREGEDRAQFMRVLLGLRIALTLLGVAVAVAVSAAEGYGANLVLGALLGGVGLLLTVVQTTLAIPLGARLRIVTVTALDVARQAGLAAVYALLVLAGTGVLPFLAATIPVMAVLVVVTAVLVGREVSMRPTVDLARWRGLLTTSLSFALAVAVGTIYSYMSQILTSFVSTAHQTGLFAAAFRTYVVVGAVPGVIVASAFPLLSRAARDDRERLRYALRKLTDAMTVVGVGLTIVLVAGAPAIIEVIAGPEFAGAVPALRIEGIAMLMTFGITTWGFGLMSIHAHRPMLISNALSLVVATVMVLLLARPHGATGAAWAIAAGESVLACSYGVSLARADRALRPRFAVGARALAAGAVALAIPFAVGLPSVPATALALLTYVALVTRIPAIPQEIVDLLPPAVGRHVRGSA